VKQLPVFFNSVGKTVKNTPVLQEIMVLKYLEMRV